MRDSDTNVGMGMCYDTPEDKEIERLTKQIKELRAKNRELEADIAGFRRVQQSGMPEATTPMITGDAARANAGDRP
jgi:molecular chaperone GrpE (heat shock protein)